MRNGRKPVLTEWQLFSLVLNAIVGIGVFSLARDVGEAAGRSSLLAIPLAGLLVVLQLIGMYLLAKRFPEQPISEYAGQILGRFLGLVYLLGYTLAAMALILVVSRSYWLLVAAWTLGKTPQMAFLVPLILVCWNTARRGIVATARTVEFINYGGLILMLVLMLPVVSLDFDLVRPVVDNGVGGVLRGIFPSIYALAGSDILLLVFPYARSKRTLSLAISAVALATLFYTVTTLFILGTLGLEFTLLSPWPLQLYLNRFAFSVFERADVVFLIVWSFQIVNILSINMYTATSCLRGVWPRLGTQRAALIILLPILIGISLPVRLAVQKQLVTVYSFVALSYLGTLPFLLWLIAVLRGKKGEGKGERNAQDKVA